MSEGWHVGPWGHAQGARGTVVAAQSRVVVVTMAIAVDWGMCGHLGAKELQL